jgi:hypothetical protein
VRGFREDTIGAGSAGSGQDHQDLAFLSPLEAALQVPRRSLERTASGVMPRISAASTTVAGRSGDPLDDPLETVADPLVDASLGVVMSAA